MMKVGGAGQVMIPAELQEESGIRPGDDVELSYEDGAIAIRRREPSERVQRFLRGINEMRRLRTETRRLNTGSKEDLKGLSRGEQFVRLLAGAGHGRMTTDEIMELTRGPYEDLDPG